MSRYGSWPCHTVRVTVEHPRIDVGTREWFAQVEATERPIITGGMFMKRMLTSFFAAAMIIGTLATMTTDASAQWGWRGPGWGWRGPGWGAGVAAGVVGGAIIAGAILASRPAGYVVYPGYAQPVYAPGCYWASQPVLDPWGRVVGYTGRPVQVCPGYAGPPPAAVAPPPPPLPPK